MDCKGRVGMIMRTFLIAFLLTGMALVGVGLGLDLPPITPLPLLVVATGAMTFLAAAVGLCGSFRGEKCMRMYLIVASIAIAAQLGLLVTLFAATDKVIDLISEDRRRVSLILTRSRWALAIALGVEGLALLSGVFLHYCFDYELEFEPFPEPSKARNLDLSKVKSSMNSRASIDIESGAFAKRLSQKMAQKYGHLSHTTDWTWDKKWWRFS